MTLLVAPRWPRTSGSCPDLTSVNASAIDEQLAYCDTPRVHELGNYKGIAMDRRAVQAGQDGEAAHRYWKLRSFLEFVKLAVWIAFQVASEIIRRS